jgi:hypothetical protein
LAPLNHLTVPFSLLTHTPFASFVSQSQFSFSLLGSGLSRSVKPRKFLSKTKKLRPQRVSPLRGKRVGFAAFEL